MNIEWSDDAANQLEKEVDYISKDNPGAASKVTIIIFKKVDLLKTMPQMGRSRKQKNTRELIISKLPYFIRYKTNNNTIQILNIFHTSRQLKNI